jgi:hypothetical protein
MKIYVRSLICLSIVLAGQVFVLGGPALKVVETDDALTIQTGSRSILRYNKSIQQPPTGLNRIYSSSGFIHPVFTPTGQSVTGAFAEDHAHQRGIWMAGTNTTFRGEKVDFWNLHKKLGRTEHAKTLSVRSSEGSASFSVLLNHVATVGERETVVLHETWTVTAHPTPEEYFLFDIESHQRLATDDPLVFNEYHYGGMATRGNNLWTPLESNPMGTCEFLTSDGLGRIEGNHTHPRWVAMHGLLDGEAACITVLCHPGNFRFPQAVRINHKLPYFTFAPMFDGEFSIQPGETYSSRYRYLVTSSKPDPKWIEQQWDEYQD